MMTDQEELNYRLLKEIERLHLLFERLRTRGVLTEADEAYVQLQQDLQEAELQVELHPTPELRAEVAQLRRLLTQIGASMRKGH